MTRDTLSVWELLEALEPMAQGLRVREAIDSESSYGHILFGTDIHRHRHLLIPIIPDSKITEDRHSSGVQMVAHTLDDNGANKRFVDLVCLKPHLNELFSIITDEVLSQIKENPTRPDYVCHQVLERWRELLEREATSLPGLEKLIGLFGELWFLRELVKHDFSAIRYWTGPKGHQHDFSLSKFAIEVKTTQSRYGLFIEIHGHKQLEPPENGQLYLVVVRVEQVVSSGESIPELIDSIVSLGGDRQMLLSLLAQIDLSLLAFDSYKDTHFSMLERRIYEVNEDFPCITTKSFVGDTLPAGVIKLNYQIDLSTEPPYFLDNSGVEQFYTELFLDQDQL